MTKRKFDVINILLRVYYGRNQQPSGCPPFLLKFRRNEKKEIKI